MKPPFKLSIAMMIIFSGILVSPSIAIAAPTACTGVSPKCTTSDKTIDGKSYSCEVCKQTVCNGGNIAGTKTTTTCTSKAASTSTRLEPVRGSGRVSGGKMQNSTPASRPSDQNQNPVSAKPFIMHKQTGGGSTSYTCTTTTDEGSSETGRTTCSCTGGRDSNDCNVMNGNKCGDNSDISGLVCTPDGNCSCNSPKATSPTGGIDMIGAISLPMGPQKTLGNKPKGDGKNAFDEADALFGKRTNVKAKNPKPANQLGAPSDLAIGKVGPNSLVLTWQDNSTREYGVGLYRMQTGPASRRNVKKPDWKFIGNFEERVDTKVKSQGKRGDQDTDLTPGTNYCYRVQAYVGFDKSETSDFSNTVCARTKSARRID